MCDFFNVTFLGTEQVNFLKGCNIFKIHYCAWNYHFPSLLIMTKITWADFSLAKPIFPSPSESGGGKEGGRKSNYGDVILVSNIDIDRAAATTFSISYKSPA